MSKYIAFLLAASVAWGQLPVELMGKKRFDYYVDSVNGSDTNSGRSQGAAWKTIAKWADRTQRAGERTGLATDSHWREQMTVTANNATVAAYGTGAKPLLDASDVIAAGAWSKTGGQTNVYQAAVTISSSGATTPWVSVWVDGTRLLRAASLAACDSTAGTYFPSADNSSPITLYVHPAGDSDPASDGKIYEYTVRHHGIDTIAAEYVTLRGLETRRNLDGDGSLIIGKYGRGYDLIARDGHKHNIYARTGAYLDSVQALGAYWAGQNLSLFIFNENTPNNEGVTFINCLSDPGVYTENSTGFTGHINISGSFGTVVYRNSTSRNASSGFSAMTLCDNCTTTGVKYSFTGSGTFTVQNSILAASDRIISVEANSTVTVQDSTGTVTNGHGVFGSGANIGYILRRNTFSGVGTVLQIIGANASVDASQNTFGMSPYYYKFNNAGYSITSDYNVFSGGTTGNRFWFTDTGVLTLAAYRAATGQDLHSTPAP